MDESSASRPGRFTRNERKMAGGHRAGLGRFEEDKYLLLLTHELFSPEASRCTNLAIPAAKDVQVVPEHLSDGG